MTQTVEPPAALPGATGGDRKPTQHRQPIPETDLPASTFVWSDGHSVERLRPSAEGLA